MGIRGELFSNKVILPNRTYFFNVKENRMGDLYLNIVESKNRDTGGFDRQSVILFADDLQEFLKGFDESLKVLEKAIRDKKHHGKGTAKREEGRERNNERPVREHGGERGERNGRGERRERAGGRGNTGRSFHGERGNPERGSRGGARGRNTDRERKNDRSERGGKRVVVKKRDNI